MISCEFFYEKIKIVCTHSLKTSCDEHYLVKWFFKRDDKALLEICDSDLCDCDLTHGSRDCKRT
jgi:hypothetical protein